MFNRHSLILESSVLALLSCCTSSRVQGQVSSTLAQGKKLWQVFHTKLKDVISGITVPGLEKLPQCDHEHNSGIVLFTFDLACCALSGDSIKDFLSWQVWCT